MCGIAGIVALAERGAAADARSSCARMAGALRHRGPDEFGVYRDARAGLAHARLSIIDLATGQQPLANEDDTLWVVFNGEIFNYVELRAELAALGHRFRTQSDTEVIVHAYEAWGDDAFARFNGQCAIALWDAKHAARSCSRAIASACGRSTRASTTGRLFFASEVKAIFAADPTIPRAFDPRRPRRDLHVLDRRSRRRRVFAGVERARARATCAPTSTATCASAPFWTPALSRRPATSELRGLARRRGRRACARRSSAATRAAHAARRRAGRQLPLRRARQLARRRARPRARRATASDVLAALRGRRVRRDARSSARWSTRLGSEHHEVVVSRRDIAARLPRGHRPHRAADPAHRARAAVPALAARARARASRSCSPARAPTRCSPATTSSARPRCAASGRASPARRRARACSSGSTRTSRARRCRSRRWRASSSAAASSARASPASPTSRAGTRPRR